MHKVAPHLPLPGSRRAEALHKEVDMCAHIRRIVVLAAMVTLHVLAFPQGTEAQQGILAGSVTSPDGTRLEGGQVSIADLQMGALTNGAGRYVI